MKSSLSVTSNPSTVTPSTRKTMVNRSSVNLQVAAGVGTGVGDGVGEGVGGNLQTLPSHSARPPQSESARQDFPTPQRPQSKPPQSTSVSVPSRKPFVHFAGVGAEVVGDWVGLGVVGEGVGVGGGGFVGALVGAGGGTPVIGGT